MYKLSQAGVVRLSDTAFIPIDANNADYAAYLQWTADGNSPLPEDAPTPAEKLSQIDAQRDEKLAVGVTWNAHLWHTDNDFQTQITALISAFNNGIIPAGTSVKVRTKDNGAILLTLDDLKSLATAVLQYVQGVYDWSWTEKDKL